MANNRTDLENRMLCISVAYKIVRRYPEWLDEDLHSLWEFYNAPCTKIALDNICRMVFKYLEKNSVINYDHYAKLVRSILESREYVQLDLMEM